MVDIKLERDIAIALRDGVVTRADVWRPITTGPVPAILVRTPYNKSWTDHLSPIDPRLAADRGYALVIQDVRGKFASGGAFEPFVQERTDGYDSVEWVAAQTWCSGQVVMSGWSYVGATQWLAAQTAPPSLRAIVPMNSSDSYGEGWSFRNGVREAGLLGTWIAGALGPPERLWLDDVERAYTDIAGLADLVPQAERWFHAPADHPYWREISVSTDRASVAVPILHIGGWYDVLNEATLRGFARLPRAADRLIVGPWAHDNWFGHLVGDRNLGVAGSAAGFGLGSAILDFYDAVLAEKPAPLPKVSVYVLGARRWVGLDNWPPSDADTVEWELRPAEFAVDPDDLPPSMGGRGILVGVPGSGWGPLDQTVLTARPDVVTYEFAAVTGPTVLAGPVEARLRVSAEGGDRRQWAGVLCVSTADGRLDVLTESVIETAVDSTDVTLALGDVCVEIPQGQRLVLLLSGGSVPRWERVPSPGKQRVLGGSRLIATTASITPQGATP